MPGAAPIPIMRRRMMMRRRGKGGRNDLSAGNMKIFCRMQLHVCRTSGGKPLGGAKDAG